MGIKKYAVVGHPIGHTMSPFIHERLFKLGDIEAEYTKIDIAPENLATEYKNTLLKLDGYNITIPHKTKIISLIDEIDEKAKMYGSVNTVANNNGIAKGYTTDPDGFLKALETAGIALNRRAVIVGCGGVARTMAYEIVLRNLPVLFAVRKESTQKVLSLCNEIKNTVNGAVADYCLIDELSGDIDILINATPLGMHPNVDSQPVSDLVISKCANVYDAIYNPLETKLIQKALANGANAVGGMSMLVWQAVVAQEKWNDVTFDNNDIAKLCIDAAEQLKNK